jgi:segregation and condensation protein B
VTTGAVLRYDAVSDACAQMEDLTRHLEALLFLAPRPLPADELAAACEAEESAVRQSLVELQSEYGPGRHGVALTEVGGGYTFRVESDCEAVVRRLTGSRPEEELSPALLETLGVAAYLQPTTRAEVAQVRGVSSEWALAALVERGLIEESGRADTPGAPILYGTTPRFLKLFGLRALTDLPPLAEFALSAGDVEEIRTRLVANAARRSP